MDALTISAQYAAYTWYSESHGGKPDAQEQALKFARDNWLAFLGNAHEGLGRLLMRVGGLRLARSSRKRRRAVPAN